MASPSLRIVTGVSTTSAKPICRAARSTRFVTMLATRTTDSPGSASKRSPALRTPASEPKDGPRMATSMRPPTTISTASVIERADNVR